MTDRPLDIADIRVQLAEVNGKLDLIAAKMEAGDRNTEQLIALVKDQLTYLAADTGELKAVVRENYTKSETAITKVRTDLEGAVTKVRTDFDGRLGQLERWQARVGGIAVIASALSAAMTGLAVKWIGGA